MHVITLKAANTQVDIFMLNVGEHLTPFGGSKSGLVVRNTASMIVRTEYADGSVTDVEHDIYSPKVWAFVARAINGGLTKWTATVPEEDGGKV